MSKLDDLLSWQQAADLTELERRDGKQQIKNLFIELVGEAKSKLVNNFVNNPDLSAHGIAINDRLKARNNLRRELRQKIQEL